MKTWFNLNSHNYISLLSGELVTVEYVANGQSYVTGGGGRRVGVPSRFAYELIAQLQHACDHDVSFGTVDVAQPVDVLVKNEEVKVRLATPLKVEHV
jgi:hypothetical protein